MTDELRSVTDGQLLQADRVGQLEYLDAGIRESLRMSFRGEQPNAFPFSDKRDSRGDDAGGIGCPIAYPD